MIIVVIIVIIFNSIQLNSTSCNGRRCEQLFVRISITLFMVALYNRADHYIFALWLLSFYLFFPRLISATGDLMSAILPHMVCLSANLGCMSEMCGTRLAENTGRKKVPKNRHLRTIEQLRRAISSQLRHVSTIGKKLVKQQYLLYMSPQYGELRPTSD